MDANKILSTELIDLIFEGRNKSYGAYELRTGYNKRLRVSLIITTAIALLILLASFISSLDLGLKKGQVQIKEVQLEEIKEDQPEPPPPPPPKPPEPPKVEMAKFTPPKVVKDEEVKEEEKPPEIEKLEDTKIGTVNQEGTKDEGIVAPPVESTVVEAPPQEDFDKVFQKVEIDAEFPGGANGWTRYVTREIERNIDELQDDGRSGTVVVLFIVDKEGMVSEVRALPCGEAGVGNCLPPNSKLAEIAVNAIRKGPKWKPAIQNGRNVKAYRRQPVTFQLAED
ncbi:MAG: energy transducer TonB [Bacteroidetes bacterium]|nr:energy transducer TonB [Bacteroidota bacterium]